MPEESLCAAQLTGPVVTQILTTPEPLPERLLRAHVAALLRAWR
jgi:hypothetical protein